MKSTLIGHAMMVAAASLALASPSAQAQTKHRIERIDRIDSNGDGVVDFSEMQAMRPDLTPEEFNKMDTNSDGQLAREEMRAAHSEAHFERRIKLVDRDGDGAISAEEIEAFHPRHDDPAEHIFKEFDADGDGKLTRQELEAMHEDMAKQGPTFHVSRPAPDAEGDASKN